MADQQDALLDFSGEADQKKKFLVSLTGKIGCRVFLKAILNFLPSFCSVTLCGKVAKNPTKYIFVPVHPLRRCNFWDPKFHLTLSWGIVMYLFFSKGR